MRLILYTLKGQRPDICKFLTKRLRIIFTHIKDEVNNTAYNIICTCCCNNLIYYMEMLLENTNYV